MPKSKFEAKYNDYNKFFIELDEQGSVDSFNVNVGGIRAWFQKAKSIKLVDKLKYHTTGIPQLGTTYPIPPDREDLINKENKPYPWYCQPWWGILVSILAMMIDSFCFYVLFDLYLPNEFIIVSAIGAAVAVDISPLFLAHNFRRKGTKKECVLMAMIVLSFILFFSFIIAAVLMRLNWFNEEQSTAIMQTLIPIATSIVCFFVNYLSFNPVAERLRNNRLIRLQLQENICELQALIVEINATPNYEDILKGNDEEMYEAARQKIKIARDNYCAYVRLKIAETLKSPADTSDLSN